MGALRTIGWNHNSHTIVLVLEQKKRSSWGIKQGFLDNDIMGYPTTLFQGCRDHGHPVIRFQSGIHCCWISYWDHPLTWEPTPTIDHVEGKSSNSHAHQGGDVYI